MAAAQASFAATRPAARAVRPRSVDRQPPARDHAPLADKVAACPIHFDPLAPEQRRDPYPVYAAARAKAPVFFAEAYGFWVVTRYEDVLAVLKDDETFSSADALRSSTVELPAEVIKLAVSRLPSRS